MQQDAGRRARGGRGGGTGVPQDQVLGRRESHKRTGLGIIKALNPINFFGQQEA